MNLFGCKFTNPITGKKDRKNFDSLLWATVTVFQVKYWKSHLKTYFEEVHYIIPGGTIVYQAHAQCVKTANICTFGILDFKY